MYDQLRRGEFRRRGHLHTCGNFECQRRLYCGNRAATELLGRRTQAVGSASSTLAAVVTITTAGTLGQISVLTQGAANKDYAFVSGGTCATGTAYTANQNCTVDFTFTPLRPGQRPGAISVTTGASSSDTVPGTAFVYGMGTGPLAAFPGSTAIHSFVGGFNAPHRVGVDGSGNVYVTDDDVVREIVSVNGTIPTSPTIQTLSTPSHPPGGVSADSSGNIYFTVSYSQAIEEIVAVNGTIPSNHEQNNVALGASIVFRLR